MFKSSKPTPVSCGVHQLQPQAHDQCSEFDGATNFPVLALLLSSVLSRIEVLLKCCVRDSGSSDSKISTSDFLRQNVIQTSLVPSSTAVLPKRLSSYELPDISIPSTSASQCTDLIQTFFDAVCDPAPGSGLLLIHVPVHSEIEMIRSARQLLSVY